MEDLIKIICDPHTMQMIVFFLIVVTFMATARL